MAGTAAKTSFRSAMGGSGAQPSSLISVLLIIGLTILSWISTYTGMLELITANTGEIGVVPMIAVGFAVAVLQLMILYVLDALFSRRFYFREFGDFRFASVPLAALFIVGYILLSVISVGFGFGFYWKFLEARTQTTASAEASIAQVQSSLQLGQSRLEQLQSTFATLATVSSEKAEKERTEGGTCPNSPPGDGPRRRLRDADAQRFQFANQYVGQRVEGVKADIAAINADLVKVLSNDASTIDPATKTRNAYLRDLNRNLGLSATRFNALRTDPQLLQIRDELALRAEQTTFPNDRGGTFVCPDAQIQTALNGAVRAINDLPALDTPEIAAVEGSEAVIEAFRRLTTSIFGVLAWQKPPTPEEVRASKREAATATGGAEASASAVLEDDQSGLGKRDYIPLAIAIFVDFCILLVSMNRPLRGPIDRLFGRIDAAKTNKMNRFLKIFYQVFRDQFNRDPEALEEFAPIQDVVFDHNGRYYAAVPLKFQDYTVSQGERTIANEDAEIARNQIKHDMSRYVANVFVALESEGFVKLNYDLEKQIDLKEKLSKQSKNYNFADAEAFRVYEFADGAWADIVTYTVVSAHKQQRKREKRLALGEATQPQRIGHDAAGDRPSLYRGMAETIDKGEDQRRIAADADKAPAEPRLLTSRKGGQAFDADSDINQDRSNDGEQYDSIKLNGKPTKMDS